MQVEFDIKKEEADAIFENVIFPSISNEAQKEVIKTAYIVGGQPGSGKSAFANSLISKNSNIVFINGDDLRVYHPKYVVYLKENDHEAADKTQRVTNYWIEKAIKYCLEREFSFIVEGTMRTENAPLLTAKIALEAGYATHGCVISSPYELSLASTNFRYVEAKRMEGYARYTKKDSHDQAYNNIPRTVETLLKEKVFNGLTIYKRLDGSFQSTNIDIESPDQAVQALSEGRERNLTQREILFIENNRSPDNHVFSIA